MDAKILRIAALVWLKLVLLAASASAQLTEPIIYVKGNVGPYRFIDPDFEGPYALPGNLQLMLRQPSGTEEVLDGVTSFDPSERGWKDAAGDTWWCYAKGHAQGTDIWRINLRTREKIQTTRYQDSWRPARATYNYGTSPTTRWSHGAWACAPCVTRSGIVFVANWNYTATKWRFPVFQLFRMDFDGKNVEQIGFLNIGGADHPTYNERTGKVIFWSGEVQGYRTEVGGLWEINPDGTGWGPVFSGLAGTNSRPIHYQTVLRNGTVVAAKYYDTRKMGMVLGIPELPPPPFGPVSRFGSRVATHNPGLPFAYGEHKKHGYEPVGAYSVNAWFTDDDIPNPGGHGQVGQPSAVDNGLLFVHQTDAQDNYGIYYIPDATKQIDGKAHWVKVVDEPNVGEYMPRVVRAADLSAVPHSETAGFPPGDPYGLVGTSAVHVREAKVLSGDELLSLEIGDISVQGGEYGNIGIDQIEYLAIYLTKPSVFRGGDLTFADSEAWIAQVGTRRHGWQNQFDERLARYSELIPLKKYRKTDGTVHYGPNPPAGATLILGPDAKADTSFAVELPADQPFLWGLANKDGRLISVGQTWHQIRPNEKRTDCRGCHAHERPTSWDWADTFAAKPEYQRQRLTKVDRSLEFHADIKPILDAKCVSCHSGASPAGGMRTTYFDIAIIDAWDIQGGKVHIGGGRSLGYFPTHSKLFSRVNSTDPVLRMPKDADPLSAAEIEKIGRWIEEGMLCRQGLASNPSQLVNTAFDDTLPPTVTIARVPEGIVVGVADPDSGVGTVSVTLDGTALTTTDTGERRLYPATLAAGERSLVVEARDKQQSAYGSEVGNLTRIVRTFTVGDAPPPDPDPDPEPDEIALLKAQILALQQQIADLVASGQAQGQQITQLQGQVNALQQKINTAKAALE